MAYSWYAFVCNISITSLIVEPKVGDVTRDIPKANCGIKKVSNVDRSESTYDASEKLISIDSYLVTDIIKQLENNAKEKSKEKKSFFSKVLELPDRLKAYSKKMGLKNDVSMKKLNKMFKSDNKFFTGVVKHFKSMKY